MPDVVGVAVNLARGGSVFAGTLEGDADTVFLTFQNPEGVPTHLKLSAEAWAALRGLTNQVPDPRPGWRAYVAPIRSA